MRSLSIKLGVILIGLIIFGYAEVSNAQCAWVLWTKEYLVTAEKITVEWKLESAYPQFGTCAMMKKRVLEDASKMWKEASEGASNLNLEVTDNSITVKKENSLLVISYECLPDTVDPRK